MFSAPFLGREIFHYLSHGLIISDAEVYKDNKESHRKSLGLRTLGPGSPSDCFASKPSFPQIVVQGRLKNTSSDGRGYLRAGWSGRGH